MLSQFIMLYCIVSLPCIA